MSVVRWRPQALEDLLKIRRFIAKDNPTRAASFVDELRDQAHHLALHPNMGRPAGPGLPDSMRMLVLHRNYLAYYRVIATAGQEQQVEVLRVKHARMETGSAS